MEIDKNVHAESGNKEVRRLSIGALELIGNSLIACLFFLNSFIFVALILVFLVSDMLSGSSGYGENSEYTNTAIFVLLLIAHVAVTLRGKRKIKLIFGFVTTGTFAAAFFLFIK